jgi:uncharacterized protein
MDESMNNLSMKDRLIIANQLKILEKLYPEEAAEYAKHRKAIEQGYKLHYSWLTEWFYDEMSEGECQEVLSILDMYRAITFSYQKAEDKEDLEESDIKFHGFDGNNEGKQFGYTLYFIVDLGRYDELRGESDYPDFNSHGSVTIDDYRRMLQVWNKYKDDYYKSRPHKLTIAQIKEILKVKNNGIYNNH